MWKQLLPYTQILQNSQIFTDGSWTDQTNNTDILFSKRLTQTKTSSAIVIMSKDNDLRDKPIITINITPQTNEIQK